MPPKRKALEPHNPNAKASKKTKKDDKKEAPPTTGATPPAASTEIEDDALQATIKRRQKRWAPVSGSKNLDASHQTSMYKTVDAFEFRCICNPLKSGDRSDDEDEEDDGGDADHDSGTRKAQACDQGKTCPCGKPTSSFPSHAYTLSRIGLAGLHLAGDMFNLRDPDTFGMYTFNDHAAYGALEVVQNMLLDFDEAYRAQQWREAWAVVEALALFMLVGQGQEMTTADDGDTIDETAEQLARMVLAALALLESKDQLANNSDVKNVGWMMALYQELAKSMQAQGLLEDSQPSETDAFEFSAANLSLYLQSYANRHGVTLPSVRGGSEDSSEDSSDEGSVDTNLKMPNMDAQDPWGWASSFSEYQDSCAVPGYGFHGSKRIAIGGDGLDISTWSSAERKRQAFDNKDPLPRSLISKLKEGLVLALA